MPNTSLSSKASHVLERTDGSDCHGDASGNASTPGCTPEPDTTDNEDGEDIDMEEPEETAEKELGKSCRECKKLVCSHKCSAPLEGLELTYC